MCFGGDKMLRRFFEENEAEHDINGSRIFTIGTYILLFVVSAGMTVLNIFTDKGFLTVSTGIFSLLCIVNIVLSLFGKTKYMLARILFGTEVVIMFTFFLVSGNPDGFSAIWIAMLPLVSMYFFGRFKGSVFCISMLIILVFFLWIPYGNTLLLYPYTDTFKMRFPVLFIAFYFVSYFLESRRANAYLQMHNLQEYYHDLSIRDQLTGTFNRQGMYSFLKNDVKYHSAKEICVAMFDIDDFKKVNDLYGHESGDAVLKKFSQVLTSNLKGQICRWGGEEFIAIFTTDEYSYSDLEKASQDFREYTFSSDETEFHVTVSIGVYCEKKFDENNDIDTVISKADMALYDAKRNGKNQVVLLKE